ncbi:hypothetical protein DJICPGNB_07700 [Escherichia coli]|nr:hypothetical protein DJICPGNB_07700 [Escherichia coli]
MMAQDFQDLTGQVIKRMMDVIQEIERQLLVWCCSENIPEQESRQNVKTRVCLMDLRSIPAKPVW